MTDSFTPLARLVLFMVCLAIFGSAVASIYSAVVDHPAQKTLQTPQNGIKFGKKCEICADNCKYAPDFYACMSECSMIC